MSPPLNQDQLRSLDTELNRATLPAIVLAILRTPNYPLGLIDRLKSEGIPADSNTVYPMIRRLEQSGQVRWEWVTSGTDRPKKYYQTTAEGELFLAEYQKVWSARVQLIEKLFQEV